MYWQSSGLGALLWSARTRGFFALRGRTWGQKNELGARRTWGPEGEPKMAEQESAAVRNANKHFRKEEQAKAGAAAWKEYIEKEEATRLKTARLRAQRLAKEAAAGSVAAPLRKAAVRTSLAKR